MGFKKVQGIIKNFIWEGKSLSLKSKILPAKTGKSGLHFL